MIEEKICHLVKTSLVDFPSRIACAVFFPGCNLRCPYCYNKTLVNPSTVNVSQTDMVSMSDLESFLEKRKKVLSGIAISGGEALLHKETGTLIEMAKRIGYKVKLDTNGTLPEKLETLFQNPKTKPDYLAVDIKTSPHKYKDLIPLSPDDTEYRLAKTLEIAFSMPPESIEIRTVLVPPLVAKEDIRNIASFLNSDCSWFFAQFQNSTCLNEEFNSIEPYTEAQTKFLVDYARQFVPHSKLR